MTAANTAPPAAKGRSAARLNAVQALYQIELGEEPARTVVDEYVVHYLGREIDGDRYREADRSLFEDLVLGVSARGDAIDQLIGEALDKNREIARLEAILRAVLRAATYELVARPDVPARVIINEYVDVAHAFFAGPEPAFVNGVIDRIGHRTRPGELEADQNADHTRKAR